ncbi:hypothetical protein ASPZODRAFT_71075 [Penicilliopsis zonata CBS 506.65]|uniref:Anaphase-promoting complex subunit 11 n=1 Tax=Penicilliopsis zonata CBS 506.65 TaxID=1073090 RepID=A0A1L9SC91_9EURO|nr:hypothetical protein ASPZODRAFT_71075 [Penicilliopsis zonata CBS 506.65]OJJ44791.1 hypothetical protein ASPZODRAFT_71075 [Penicilliopsis zonata CBS 506.65]
MDDALTAPTRKSRSRVSAPCSTVEVIDPTGDDPTPTPKKQKKTTQKAQPETRARRWRPHAPASILHRIARARTQRMVVANHIVTGTGEDLSIKCDIVGSTGNLYETCIGKVPTCNCPDSLKGNQCKHIFYVLVNALKAPPQLQYQLAYLSSELREMYDNSPLSRKKNRSAEEGDGTRRPIEGECPVCFMQFDPSSEAIVWCRAVCGNNIHKTCFEQWAQTDSSHGVRCVICRSPWQGEEFSADMEALIKNGSVNEEGYMNIGRELGLSSERDSSGYYRPGRRQRSHYYGWARR